jgi:hypothetical protein
MSKYKYNSWPLGKLPDDWQRPEPKIIRELGYEWEDARDINEIFESKLAAFGGTKYACLTDSCSNALFLALKYRKIRDRNIEIPNQTYASVPMQIIHSGNTPVFREIEWSGLYSLGDTGVVDSAARFRQGLAEDPETSYCLSFQIKKRLPIGRGGAILTNDRCEYEWLRRAVYDGRALDTPYDSEEHVSTAGWHMYMTPEDAARGIILFDMLGDDFTDTMSWRNYPPLDSFTFFKRLSEQTD